MGAISTKTATQRELETLEKEIASEISEAFYHIGQKLLKIKRDRLYEAVDCKSWEAYCRSGRIEYAKAQANKYIRCSQLRTKLPKADSGESGWTIIAVEELCKCKTDKDAVRVSKKAIKLAKETNQRLTAKLIATVRDRDTGKAQKELAAVSLEKHLDKLATILLHWRISLEQVEAEQWDDCNTEILTRVKNESRDLAAYLRS